MDRSTGTRYSQRLADSLTGPRVYSTDFHPGHFLGVKVDDELERAILRSLKVKLLTKATVTINGAHLLNPPVVNILRKNEALLGKGLLLPALREDKASFADYVADHERGIQAAGWSDADRKSAADFVDSNIDTVLPWRVEQAQEPYRHRVIGGLTNTKSRVHRKLMALAGFSDNDLARLVKEVETLDLKEDGAMRDFLAQLQVPVRDTLLPFTHACYHLVGTDVVNCETGTDLAELADFRVDEMTDSDVFENMNLLSDTNIFLRCCFATAMQAINEQTFPVIIVDQLSFDDIVKARGALADQGFQRKYDEIVGDFLRRLASEDSMRELETWDAEKTAQVAKELSEHFARYLNAEVPDYRKAIHDWHRGEAIRAGADTVKGLGEMVVGAVPGLGELVSILDLSQTAFEGAEHAIMAAKSRDFAFADAEARRQRDEQIERALEVLSPKNKATILTGLRQLREVAAISSKPN